MNIAPRHTRFDRKNLWLLTFGDVITLLIVFFVLIITTGRGEISKAQQWTESTMNQSTEELGRLMDLLKVNGLKVQRTSRGILVRIAADQAFSAGDTQLLPAAERQLRQLMRVLSKLSILRIDQEEQYQPFLQALTNKKLKFVTSIDVLGYSTDAPPQANLLPAQANHELSLRRAREVAFLLQSQGGFAPDLMTITGFGSRAPLENTSGNSNRVDIYINALVQRSFDMEGNSPSEE